MRRILGFLIAVCLITLVFQLAWAAPEAAVVRVGSLKGPTSMGLAKLMQDEQGQGNYDFTVAGTADELVPLLAKGDLDIALVPCNLASVLYQRLQGNLQMTAINNLGVLNVLESGESVQSVDDLRGQTLLSTGKGTTPEYALRHVLSKNALDPDADLTIDYKSEATEVAAALSSGTATLAMLPQPYATAVMAQNPDLRVALSLSDEWDRVSEGSALVTGVVVMRKDFIEQNPDAVRAFMDGYKLSTAYVNEHPAEMAPFIEELGIGKAAVVEAAIPLCNIVCITGDEMKEKAVGYLNTLNEQDPQSVGGQVPDEAFYWTAE